MVINRRLCENIIIQVFVEKSLSGFCPKFSLWEIFRVMNINSQLSNFEKAHPCI